MIEVRDLEFNYPESRFSIHLASLSLAAGQRCCWIGPSGSGKTTLLHLVAGILVPESGRVTTCDTELTSLRDNARREFRIQNVGLVFQDFALLDHLTVRDNILLPYRISHGLRLDQSVASRAERLVETLGLESMYLRRPAQLSQGERQRVAVCRALITRPRLVLADEPTANLDPANAALVLDAMVDYATEQQATLVLVSHDQLVQQRFDDVTDVSQLCEQRLADAQGGLLDA